MTSTPGGFISATWFDGHTAAAHPVGVEISGRDLSLRAVDGTIVRTAALDGVQLSEPSANAPTFVYFGDGSTLEVHDAESFNCALDALGRRPSLVARLQRSARAATGALALLLALFVLGYTHGLPLLARWVAFALPAAVEARVGDQFERTLDLQLLKASELTEEHQARLSALLRAAAARGAPAVQYVLKSRATRTGEGVNAFSLPGGTIILLDGLVNAASAENQVLAVLGHEMGHVANKHGMRNLLQALGIAAIASATWGDFAGAAASVPVVFGSLHYSRAFELEADRYAVEFLRANGLGAQPLIDFFESIAARTGEPGHGGLGDFFSTHPQTNDRIELLKRME
jgi:Zn-dependent protease with chaperone function